MRPIYKMRSLCDIALMSNDLLAGTSRASKAWETAIAFGRDELGDHDPETVWAMEMLARVYSKEGRSENARVVLEAVLQLGNKRGHGTEAGKECNHESEICWTMYYLARVYEDLGRLKDALKLAKKAAKFAEKKWGSEHEKSIMAMGELIHLDVQRNHRLRALMRLKKTLPLSKTHLGEDSSTTIWMQSEKAYLYSIYGRYDEEVELHQQVLTQKMALYGAEDSTTLRTMKRLASAHAHAKKSDVLQATKWYEEFIAGREKRRGRDDEARLWVMDDLASCYYKNKNAGYYRKVRATKLWEEILEARTRTLGPEHRDTLLVRLSLARVHNDSEEPDRMLKALEIREEVARSMRKEVGLWDLDNLSAMVDLAESYGDFGRTREQFALFVKFSLVSRVIHRQQPSYTTGANETFFVQLCSLYCPLAIWTLGRFKLASSVSRILKL